MSSNQRRNSSDTSGTAGRVKTTIHDVQQLRETFPEWDDLNSFERYLITREPDFCEPEELNLEGREIDEVRAVELLRTVPPEPEVSETSNTTVAALNEYIVDNLDPNQTVDLSASHLAVGDDASSGTAVSDSALNNEVYRTSITDTIDNANDLTTSTFLDSTEANGYTLDEVGLYTASSGGTLLNHAAITALTKDNTKTATIDVELQFRSA